ncbi:hypothetical protein ACWGH2_24565 [Streptomyces sp. NPDC054871]
MAFNPPWSTMLAASCRSGAWYRRAIPLEATPPQQDEVAVLRDLADGYGHQKIDHPCPRAATRADRDRTRAYRTGAPT